MYNFTGYKIKVRTQCVEINVFENYIGKNRHNNGIVYNLLCSCVAAVWVRSTENK
jgi:hypothetical protein